VLLVFLFCNATAFAQEQVPDATDNTEVIDILQDEGSNTTQVIITADDIAKMKVNKIEDVLNQAPGVSASSTSVAIHGSHKVRVLLDGTPLNDPTSSYGAINLDHISLNSVDKIVIIKDAGGLHYGQDATGGVILIHTKNFGASNNSGQIRVWGGNYDTYHGDMDLMFNRGLWGIGVKGGYERSQGYKINTDSVRIRGGFKVSRRFGEDKTMTLSVDYLTEKMGFSGLPAYPTPHSRQKSGNLTATHATTWKGLVNNLYYNRGEVRNTDFSRNLDQELTVIDYGDSLSYTFPLGPGELSLGAGFRGIMARSSEFGNHQESIIHFFFAQSLKIPRTNLTLRAGARYNINSAFENTLNPELSLSYQTSFLEAIYKISRGTNLPSFQQRYNRSSSTNPNPSLGIEKALNQSLTVNLFPTDWINFHVTLFHNTLEGRISYIRPANYPIGRYENLGKTLYEGVDFGFTYKPIDLIEVSVNYTYLNAMDKDIDHFLTSRSRNSFNAELVFKPTDEFMAAVKADYKSREYNDRYNTTYNPSRILYSLRAEQSFGSIVAFLDISNILDKEYFYVDGLLAPPRIFFLGLKYNF
jgi:iron complex outermembrane receptor protein